MRKVLFFFLTSYNIVFSYINIYPTKFEKNIENGVGEVFKLYNRTETQIKYRIYLEKGKESDMSEWIEVYPRSIILNPTEEKEIKIFITPPTVAKKGLYKAKLIVKQVEGIQKTKNNKVNFMTLFKLNMTGYIGDDLNEEK